MKIKHMIMVLTVMILSQYSYGWATYDEPTDLWYDFTATEGYSAGDLNGQNGWSTTIEDLGSITVDPVANMTGAYGSGIAFEGINYNRGILLTQVGTTYSICGYGRLPTNADRI
ncbi:MAG: hypothetical protein Q8Q33_09020 [Chlamydiota bacterium]|nr:hypothetical protein [Chlamydiota bacterium]